MKVAKITKKDGVFLMLAILIYGVGIYLIGGNNWIEETILLLPTTVVSVVSILVFNYGKPGQLNRKENAFVLMWAAVYILLCALTAKGVLPLVNEVSNWIWLVAFPFFIVKFANGSTIRDTLTLIGLRFVNKVRWKKKLVLICLGYLPFLIIFAKYRYNITASMLMEKWVMLLFFPLVFIAMMLMAGSTEEIFFRGMVQRNIYNATKSQVVAVLAASLLFALFHLPYAYYMWPGTQGNLLLSAATIVSEQFIAGILMGVAYIRSSNLWVPIILHSLTNSAWVTASLLTSESIIKFG